MNHSVRLALVAVAATLIAAAPAHAQPQASPAKRAEAKTHFENGQRYFDVGKFDDAAREFVATYELIGDPLLLYNIAQAYRLADKPKESLFFYKRFLSRAPASSPQKKEVERRINELNQLLALRETTTKAKPTGTIRPGDTRATEEPDTDEKPQPQQPKPEEKPAQMPEEKPAQMPEEKPTPEPAPTERGGRSPLVLVGVVAAAVGVVAIGVGVAMSVLAGARAHDLENAAAMGATFDANLQAIESRGKLYDALSIPLYVVGGVAIAAGAALFVVGRMKSRPAEAAPQARLAPWASPSGGGLVLSGGF